TVIWIVGITNTINLIDGLDGLAAGITAIASFSMAYIAYLNDRPEVALITLAIAGGTLGFLPYNFNPAKIFMGDGGSLFLGLMLATVSIIGPMKGAAAIATVMPVLVLGLPIFDTAFAIYRRLLNGKSIMEADKGHIHHRILSKGMNQKKTVIILYALSGILGVSAILVNKNMILETTVLIILTSALIYVFTRMDDSEIGEKNEQ
ncbi:MAG: MraY family glycosyltransferase, partial [Peptostreptococcales bacterium]